MAYKDFRAYLETLEKKGELARIKAQVDWDEEVGAIYQENIRRRGPTLLFENIKGYKDADGRKIAAHTVASMRRCCISLGIDEGTPREELINFWRERSRNLIKPMLVSTGPCKEVIHKGNDVNVLEFPAPKLHPLDGGRYLLTWYIMVTKDPETGWVNVGTYRGMVIDKNSIGMNYHTQTHWSVHGAKYLAMGKPMPVVAAIGIDPILMFLSTTPQPYGVCEYDIAGGIRKEPMELVKCETIDLEVPAGAEIVVEGEMSLEPSTFLPEGPFGEYPGHYSGLGAEPKPVFKVKCITHRKDPILTISSPGMDPGASPEIPGAWGTSPYMGFVGPALILDHFEKCNIYGVKNVASYSPGGQITCVSVKQPYYGYAKQIAAALWSRMGRSSKYVIVVDDDIDVTDFHKVFIAIGNRAQGEKSISIFKDTPGADLDPASHPDVKRKLGGTAHNDRILIDATWPWEWQPREEWGGLRYPPPCRASKEMVAKVQKRWKQLGLPE